MTSESLYEVYHAACPFPHFGCDSFHADKAIAAYDDAKSVLDFGCGNGYAVKQMQSDGLNWIGVEVSQTAYEKHLQSPGFYLGTTNQFQDRQFDVYTIGCIDPCPQLEQLSVTSKLRFLAADDAAMTSPAMKKFLIRGRCSTRPRVVPTVIAPTRSHQRDRMPQRQCGLW